MGSTPLRKVFETAFGLPASFGALDLDTQLATFRARAEKTLGVANVSQFSDPVQLDKVLRQFLLRSQAVAGLSSSAPGASALQLLQATGASSASGLLSLLR